MGLKQRAVFIELGNRRTNEPLLWFGHLLFDLLDGHAASEHDSHGQLWGNKKIKWGTDFTVELIALYQS